MTNWTSDQLKAINESGKNIIVSAGAGSGKTAVLTERVITKLRSGININELLVLTFTNAAASEMKQRIRKAIKDDISLKNNLEYIDSSYITTFDSFSMSLVKKYHYLLNISPNLKIIDKSIMDYLKVKMLDEIFENLYEKKEEKFVKFINDLTIKDDLTIKKGILNVNEKLDRLINKEVYLSNYINNYYNEENINNLINHFFEYIFSKIKYINELLNNLYNCTDEKFYEKMYGSLKNLINSKSYEEIVNNINIKLPSLPKNSAEEVKIIKTKISEEIKYLKNILIYRNENHLRKTLLSTKEYAEIIIEIILELDEKILMYKNSHDRYEFNDIALLAIKLVEENDDVLENVKNSFKEIMIDEYQDTSDIQEYLIKLISSNNVYMVGDVKQSIYRFRNANPDIFKEKYDNYSNINGGIKIDLLANFRSREEVVNDINIIFNNIMDEKFGGADYKNAHQMKFGNLSYKKENTNYNNNLEIYNYKKESNYYSSSEYEAFIIANDIKTKMNSNYKIMDKETKKLRNINYEDICILIDRKMNFELYKKIFEYLGVPLVIYYDEKITNENDILLLKNIIDFIIKIYNNIFDSKFKYDFYSIARSYLFNMSDQEYIEYYNNNNFYESDIYIKAKEIARKLNEINSSELIDLIVKEFNMYESTIKVGDIEKFIIHIDYIKSLASDLSLLGYDIMDFSEYLNEMTMNESDITFSLNTESPNNVRLMNIHKSKGLEFPICYYAGFDNRFNRMDLNEKLGFDPSLGFILPFYEEGIGNTIVKELYRIKYNNEDISERIRLFYVALTRAKEKMIIVAPLSEDNCEISEEVKSNYHSFLDIINSIKYYLADKIVDIEMPILTKAYDKGIEKIFDIKKTDKKIDVKEINIENNEKITKKVASKHIKSLITQNEKDNLEYGTKLHKVLEISDFMNSNNEIVKKFVSHFTDLKLSKIYKEYEFLFTFNNTKYHGIIDLVLEYENEIKVIDYKTKNINDENYINQLKVYKEYLSNKTDKVIKIFLYSIIDDELLEIN